MAKDQTKQSDAKAAEAPAEVSEELARQQSQVNALAEAEAKDAKQSDMLQKLLDEQEKLRQNQVVLEAELDRLRRERGEAKRQELVKLHGQADPIAEKKLQDAIWPKDAERTPGPIKTRTYHVEPVGASVEQGMGPALVDNCYDAVDAKAAYMRQYKPELHHLPVQIHEVKSEASSAA